MCGGFCPVCINALLGACRWNRWLWCLKACWWSWCMQTAWRRGVTPCPAVCVGDPDACGLSGDHWCLQFNLVHLCCLHSSISAHWYSVQLYCLQCLCWCIRYYLCTVFITSQMYLYLFSAQGPTVILINIFSYWLVICGDDWWVLSKLQVLYISVKLVDATDWSGHFYFCINDLYSP